LPEAVASDVTEISLMKMATASPTSARSTATGSVTSCPPLIAGVIIGPQHPGAVLATMCPASRTGPSISELGPMIPSQKRSTKTVCDPSALRTLTSTAMALPPRGTGGNSQYCMR
jgi:hypothetical protein